MNTNQYTVEIYKIDRRTKKGERLVEKVNVTGRTFEDLNNEYSALDNSEFRYSIHETYVTRTSVMSGKEFQERYDTSYTCSPSSETYWCS
jgi:hypothetical protein